MQAIVIQTRDAVTAGRQRTRSLHDAGTPGVQVSNQLANLYDDTVLALWHSAIQQHTKDPRLRGLALVAHGGFGRRDMAPFSDADLMLLSTRRGEPLAAEIAGSLTRDLNDCGIDAGFSIRSPTEACQLSWTDSKTFSSLTESRFLVGSLHLYQKFFKRFRRGANRRQRRIIEGLIQVRLEEREKWGETNFLLRPNVKRSRGGLRDIQLIRWLGFVRFGESELDRLVHLGGLPREDYRVLRSAFGFLLRVRHELHFRYGREHDILDRSTQMDIATAWGYAGYEGMLPVEQFMQKYFAETSNVRYAAGYLVEDSMHRSPVKRLVERGLSRPMDSEISMGPRSMWVRPAKLNDFAKSLPKVLRLMSLANQYDRRIEHQTWSVIRQTMQDGIAEPPNKAAYDSFIDLLRRPHRLASLLRRLHELRIIEQFIPQWKRMRGLLQFNAYHKYTVDAHSLLAVDVATELSEHPDGMGRRYRRIDEKWLLHLALLIHDIGKGYEEDHCIVGERIAEDTARRFGLDSNASDTLRWLVLKHLEVNVVAFRHDLNDPQILLSFAKEVGSLRRLELLVVHSFCDLTAVGPDVATDWKVNLMNDLYRRTRTYFDSGDLPSSQGNASVEDQRTKLREAIEDAAGVPPANDLMCLSSRGVLRTLEQDGIDLAKELTAKLPLSLILRCQYNTLAQETLAFVQLTTQDDVGPICLARFDPMVDAARYTIMRSEGRREDDENSMGTFATATAALAANGLSIVRAQIETVDGFAWNSFWAVDPTAATEDLVDLFRLQESCDRLCELVSKPDRELPQPRRVWQSTSTDENDRVHVLPTQVMFDNDTVSDSTIISFFAYDQVGLLASVAEAFTELGLELNFAKIDTHLDQVADVFYVTDRDGNKLVGEERLREVRERLLKCA